MLYKYRSIKNLQFFIDILINERMYAARFTDLNDPMEGFYKYSSTECNRQVVKDIWNNKNQIRILSLSKSYKNPLMWSHYADGHQGVVIGVEFSEDIEKVDVEYSEYSYFLRNTRNVNSEEVAKKILSTKYKPWYYEEEVRIFTTGDKKFIPVEIKEIIMGKKMESEVSDLIIKTINKVAPEITTRKMDEIEHEQGYIFKY